ncbi:glycosyltransferase family 2 protein [Halomonas sp.]|uniref:glycosyltransferase family 2 protein n=1 Tax=Halomonas sp. TaxID=1486246 RepID=UPI000C92AD4F|nr:glycosyltransferase family 2 protein [Halomonas sp.]MAR71620.1 glycosyl transferase [Halomonas sp.]|tara:strand:- start:6722 stop:7657 length:936 start_codon:yes stop_codon:yes gene_type:complete
MLGIVIVNWNSGEQLEKCLKSFLPSKPGSSFEVVVVDNGSSDGSQNCCIAFPEVTLLPCRENLGFAKACNIGAKRLNKKYLLFLNPDTIIDNKCLWGSVYFMENDANSNIAVCGIALKNEDNKIERSCAYLPSFLRIVSATVGLDRLKIFNSTGIHMRDWDHESTKFVDHVIGAYYLIRKSVFDLVNGFDEDYFVYIEDLDLSRKVKKEGYQIIYIREYVAFHAGGGTSRQVKAKRLFYSIYSRLVYSAKNFGVLGFLSIYILSFTMEFFLRFLGCVVKLDTSGIKNLIMAYQYLASNSYRIFRLIGSKND